MQYEQTQAIGAAVAFLECDGLLAPSARWTCETLALFVDNHAGRLEAVSTEEVDWPKRARANDLLV